MPTSSFDKGFVVTKKEDIESFKNALNLHVWIIFKNRECCKKCGILKNESNTQDECKGESKIRL